MSPSFRALLIAASLCLSTSAAATPDVPDPLKPWVPWVLRGHEQAVCPRDGETPLCAWPGRLELVLDDSGGRFSLDVRADTEIDLPLPGDAARWPRDLRTGSAPAELGQAGGRPAVRLPAGTHRVTGRFAWSRLPESLAVPPTIGIVDLSVQGRSVRTPRRDADGLLWLRGGATEEAEEDRLAIEVHRRIDDGVPVQVTTRLRLRVSGKSREVALGRPMPDATLATALTSSLPARLDPDGSLLVQLRPGDWEIRVQSRSAEPVAELRAAEAGPPWPEEETWVFQSAPEVRSVRVDGAPGVDPARTSLPDEWRRLPAWRVARGGGLQFIELRRGAAEPPPDQLSVSRELWLSLDGEEFAVRDVLGGSLFQGGRLEMQAPGRLGRAAVGGQDQLITVGTEGRGGVEVRDGRMQLTAVGTLPRDGELPAVGWDRDAQSLTATLQLPPGWSLLTASGVDDAGGAWLDRWTLMDLFLVLLVSLAVGRLTHRRWGLLALLLLALSWQEPEAPKAVWIALVAALGLLRVLPAGLPARAMDLLRWGIVVVLAVQATVFCWSASRAALFPQLEQHGRGALDADTSYGFASGLGNFEPAQAPEAADAAPMEQLQEEAGEWVEQTKTEVRAKSGRGGSAPGKVVSRKRASRLDPQAVVQTGPGLPRWTWRSHRLYWNGPVAEDHTVRLWLIGPVANGALGLLRVLGTVALLLLLADPRRSNTRVARARPAPAAALLLLLLPGLAQAQTLPDPAMLDALRARLLERPACEPDCVQVAELRLRADGAGLVVDAELHADAAAPWKLPGPDSAWVPSRVELDGAEVIALRRDASGFLMLRVPEGVHRVRLSGPARDEVPLQFPKVPRVLSWSGDGWTIAGYRPDTEPPGSVQLSRSRPLDEGPGGSAEENAELPPWLEVSRELDLGVPWLVHNELRRLGGGNRAVLARVPLLPGESVTSPGIPVEGGEAVVALEPGETVRAWDSTLSEAERLTLTAPADRPWTESWSLDCSPIWSCGFDGLAPTRHLADGRWAPTWAPWPGESLTLSLQRPPPAEGVTTTVDSATLELTSGRRLLEGALEVQLRSSQGGEQSVTLPAGATLRSFQLDGRDHPAQAEGDRLVFAVEPGAHTVSARWSQPGESGLLARAPRVELGQEAANVQVRWNLPEHRWVLWTWGPRWGPVVTVWQYLLVLLLAAGLLGRLAPTPLTVFDWFLLGLGMTQVPPPLTGVLVLWLVALALRGRGRPDRWWKHDAAQLALVGLTLVAFGVLYGAVYTGLVVRPDLGVEGGGSSGGLLQWFADRSDAALPRPGVLWLPLWLWRVAMLLWSLWLASRLLRWLRWGWEQFAAGGLFTIPEALLRKPAPRRTDAPSPASPPATSRSPE